MNSETRNCQNCHSPFIIEPDDFAFYEKMAVPPPTWCPACRLMRRLTWRNERALYRRTCDLCKANIIAMYSADAPFPVYCKECWYSDKWDATSHGRDYDFSKSFFKQFHDLLQVVPQIALQVSTSPGSDYVNQVANCKDCYLIASGSDNENCMYCYRVLYSKDVLDSSFIEKLESSYECVQCMDSFNIRFGDDCIGDTDVSFCSDVHGSQQCCLSSNKRRASYVFRNEQLTKEAYAERLCSIDTGSYAGVCALRQELADLRRGRLHKYMTEKNAVGCTGNAVADSMNAKHCFVSGNLRDCKYALMLSHANDAYDVNNGCCTMELAYECSTAGVNTYNTKLSADVWPEVRNTTYSQSCRNDANHLFGCVSVRKKQYCILNKQYSKEEYESLVPRIKKHMDEMSYIDAKGREYKYGEFFPPELSLYAYNETPAQDYFPKTKSEVEAMGFTWRDEARTQYTVTLAAKDLPDHIKDAPDDITQQVIGCAHEGVCERHQCPGAFRITAQELQFYRKKNIALPRLCPNCRHYERFAVASPYRLWKRTCMCTGGHAHGDEPCTIQFETPYAPERPERVFCESCYNAEVV